MNFDWKSLSDFAPDDNAYATNFRQTLISLSANNTEFDITPILTHSLSLGDGADFGSYVADIFLGWRDGDAPLNSAIIQSTLSYFDIEPSHAYYKAAMISGVLADIAHDNIYHNNHHFREVIVLLCLLLSKHNAISTFKLSKHDIALLLTCAGIHDFAHDGEGNVIKGGHMPSRLEKRAFNRTKPFLQKALGDNEDVLNKIALLLICTDVSRGETGRSPAGYTRDIFLGHEYDNIQAVNVPEIFDQLIKNPMLSAMALLLCEADIGVSTGLTYDFAKKMTCFVAAESDVLMPSATTLHGFMDVICHGGFSTTAAQQLMGENFEMIQKLALKDMGNNVLYA